jgi:Leucine Rich repeat
MAAMAVFQKIHYQPKSRGTVDQTVPGDDQTKRLFQSSARIQRLTAATSSTHPAIMATPAEADPSIVSSPVRHRYIPDNAEELNLRRWRRSRRSRIRDEGAKLLAEELATNNTLETLVLCGNWISDDGAFALADALATNKTLKVLRLSENLVADKGIEALGQVLTRKDSLERLDVSENKFGIVGLASFAAA